MLDSILNADVLYYAYTIIGFLVFYIILYILKFIVNKTANKYDDKIVDTLEKWHEVNKNRIKK